MKRVRQADIAGELGISQMAVSKDLRGASDISEATRKRVAEAAHRLGYQANHFARSLPDLQCKK